MGNHHSLAGFHRGREQITHGLEKFGSASCPEQRDGRAVDLGHEDKVVGQFDQVRMAVQVSRDIGYAIGFKPSEDFPHRPCIDLPQGGRHEVDQLAVSVFADQLVPRRGDRNLHIGKRPFGESLGVIDHLELPHFADLVTGLPWRPMTCRSRSFYSSAAFTACGRPSFCYSSEMLWPSAALTWRMRSSSLTGLIKKANAPFSMACVRACESVQDVTTMTGSRAPIAVSCR